MSVKKYFYYHVSVVAIFFITVPLTSFAQIATQMPAMSQPATDTTPPTITHVVTTSAGITDATIVWNTNVPATSKFEYGKTKNYGTSAVMDTAQLTTHAINLMNLSSGTTYFYCIHATDMAGNETASCEHSFVTAPPRSEERRVGKECRL